MNVKALQIINKYLQLGLQLIPLKGKRPLVKWKDFVLTDDNKSYWINKNVNWGIKTGLPISSEAYFYVVDLDDKNLLADLVESEAVPMDAPLVSTNRGFHIYLTWHEAVQSRQYLGVDIKGIGGYVVAPPSIHLSGKPYRFITPIRDHLPVWDPEKLAQSIVLGSSSHKPDYSRKHVQINHSSILTGVPEGQRHNALLYYLGAMFKARFREEVSLSRALAWNMKNRPPLPKQEVIATVKRCYEAWDPY